MTHNGLIPSNGVVQPADGPSLPYWASFLEYRNQSIEFQLGNGEWSTLDEHDGRGAGGLPAQDSLVASKNQSRRKIEEHGLRGHTREIPSQEFDFPKSPGRPVG